MAYTPDQLRNWITTEGYGSFDPSGKFSLNTGPYGGNNSALTIMGAANQFGVGGDQLQSLLGDQFGQLQNTWQGAGADTQANYRDKAAMNWGGAALPPSMGGADPNAAINTIQQNPQNAAMLGPTNRATPDQIRGFVDQYKNDPEAIRFAANKFGVSLNDIQNATGYSSGEVGNWLQQNNMSASQFPGAQAGIGAAAGSGNAAGLSSPMGMTPPTQGAPTSPMGQQGGFFGGSNPYAGGMADDITRRSQDFLNANLRNIRGNSVMAGGYSSATGLAQGKALSGAADALQGNLSNLYGGLYNQDANRGLQRYGMDQNFYTAQRGQDQSGMALGASMMGQGLNMDWAPLQNASSLYAPYSGMGSTTTGSQQGGGWTGALGGALGAGQFAKNMGWWG